MRKIDDSLIDLSFYPVKSRRRWGGVIVCPGGGYHTLAAHEGEPMARWLNRAGLSAFVLRYRVAPHRYPAPLEDLSRAVRLVRSRADEFAIRGDKIAVLGFSAAGHLVTALATHFDAGDPAADEAIDRTSSRPDAVIAGYPVTSVETFRHEEFLTNLLGEERSPEVLHDLSNEHHVTPDTPPVFLWHTAEDETVPVEQSLLFARALIQAGVPFELHVFPHGAHGLGLGDGSSFVGRSGHVAQWTTLCEAWLRLLGFMDQ